jgi:hypothetical protein
MLYCVTVDPNFYSLATLLTVTSIDNGGKVTKVTLTFSKAFDDVTNNADVLAVLCVMATNLALAPEMV